MKHYRNNISFDTVSEAKQYPEWQPIRLLEKFKDIPKGKILSTIDSTTDFFILRPLGGVGYYCFVPKTIACLIH